MGASLIPHCLPKSVSRGLYAEIRTLLDPSLETASAYALRLAKLHWRNLGLCSEC
jgi:hypothetical protein